MTDLLCDDDFELDAAGYLRMATPLQSVRQEIGRPAEEAGWVAQPLSPALASEMQAATTAMLRQHPDVSDVGVVTIVQDSEGNVFIKAAFDGLQAEVQL
jgi:hypothetical protein